MNNDTLNYRLGWILLIAVVLMGLLANQAFLPVGITWNRSASLPLGLYGHTKTNGEVSYEDIVCVRYKAPGWAVERRYFYEGALLCKYVLGLPGDRIVRQEGSVQICRATECVDAGLIQTHDSAGRPVPAAELPEVIPEGQAYLGVPYVKMSFDSRYLGLVDIDEIERTLIPLFVWRPI